MAEQLDVRYTGDARLVGALAQMLQDEGLEVEYDPPFEKKSMEVDIVALVLAVSGHPDIRRLVSAAVARFKERFPGGGDTEIED